jgi:hypothetical protein
MKKIRVISDVHGERRKYLALANNCEYSVQLGDLDFDYEFLNELDPDKHKFFPGNHSNYDKCFAYPHCLGDYGPVELNGVKFFFVRGGFSIDWAYRTRHYQFTGEKIMWAKEQLSLEQMEGCLALYKEVKPDFVISHEGPTCASKKFGNSKILKEFGYDPETFTTNTQELLQAMFDYHQPKRWIMGHLHVNRMATIGNTKFNCLPILGCVNVNEEFELV